MRVRASVISVPVSMIYAAAAVSTGEAIIIALGIIMVVAAAGYLVSELQSRHGLESRLHATPARVDDRPSHPDIRQLAVSRPPVGEQVFAAVFMAVTFALTILLAANAAMPLGG